MGLGRGLLVLLMLMLGRYIFNQSLQVGIKQH